MKRNDTMLRELEAELFKKTKINKCYPKHCGLLTLEALFTTDSVYLAAQRCAAGFRNKRDTQKFLASPWLNSKNLAESVLGGDFTPKYYSVRIITERGKARKIKPPTFECKIVQKVICDYLIRPLLEHHMIHSNYASIKGKGTDLCYKDILKAVNKTCRTNKDAVIVLTDFTQYFASIDIDILCDMLRLYIKDERLISLIRLFSPEELSLGNELSQVPASFFPSKIDHWAKDRMGLPYFRYMDDSLCITESLAQAENYISSVKQIASDLRLEIKEEKIQLITIGTPFVFCKERFLFGDSYYRIQNPEIARNEKRKIKGMHKKKVPLEKVEHQFDTPHS